MAKYMTLLLFSSLLSLSSLAGKKSDFTKSFEKSFDIQQGALLGLDCSFANVVLSNHPANRIEISVVVTVNGSNESKAEKVFDEISVKLIGSPSKVEVITELGQHNMKNISFEIDVNIKAPAHILIDAELDFGNMELPVVNGKAIIRQQYGNLRAGELNASDNRIEVGFGNARIGMFGGGYLQSDFGDLRVEELRGNSEIKTSYGNLGIDKVAGTCRDLKVNSEFGNADIVLDPSVNLRIEAHSSMGEIDWDNDIQVTREKNDWTSNKMEGQIGSGSGILNAGISFGNLNIKVR